MATYNIYHKDGTLLTSVKKVTYNDNFMGESNVSVEVKSATVVNFAIGDYIDYKGRRFYMAVHPTVEKSARKETHGAAFKYSAVKFTSASGYDMTRCKMRDVVLKSQESVYNTNYTAQTFSFYCNSLINFGERLQANLDRMFEGDDAWVVKVRLNDGTDHVCDGTKADDHSKAMGEKNITVTISDQTCWDALAHVKDDFKVHFVLQDKVVSGKNVKVIVLGCNGTVLPYYFRYGQDKGVFKFTRSTEDNQAIVTRLRAYGNETNMPIRYYNKQEGTSVGDTINVSKLMLPGFGITPLKDVVKANFNVTGHDTLTNRIRAAVNNRFGVSPGTFTQLCQYLNFSEVAIDPYIEVVPQKNSYGVREGEVTFDGSGDYEDIHPSLEWLGESNKLIYAEQITDDGYGDDEDNIPEKENFVVKVSLTFNPADYISYGKTSFNVSMRSGMCGGRTFECYNVEVNDDGTYTLHLKRVQDNNRWFPYKDFNLAAGDEYVLTDLDMPKEYVEGTALQELLPQAIVALLDNCDTRYKYSLDVDNIAMKRQHDTAVASESIYNTIAAGCEIWFGDDDLDFNFDEGTQQVTGHVLIDKVEIKEEDGGIPKYDITLVDEVEVGTLEAIQKKLDSITSGKISIGGGGGGGGYTEADIQNICRALGDARYLRLTGGTVSGAVGIDGNLGVTGDANVKGVLHATKLVVDNLEIMEAKHIAGKVISSPASAEIVDIDKHNDSSVWDLLFAADDTEGNPVENMFVKDDMIWCEQYRVDYGGGEYVQNKVYWRRVLEVGDVQIDGKYYNYVRVDVANADSVQFSGLPAVGDTIVTLGNLDGVNHADRQNAMISSPVGNFQYKAKTYKAPYECQYVGIGQNGFVMPDPINVKSPSITVVNADVINLTSGGTIGGQDEWKIYSVDWNAEIEYDEEGNASLKYPTLEPGDVDVSEDWKTKEYASHIGDYIVTANGYCYRFELTGANVYQWKAVEDELLLELQSQIKGIQQSGIRTEKQFAEMWSKVISSEDGKTILSSAGVLTKTNYDEGTDSWWSSVELWGDQINMSATHQMTLNVGTFVVNGDNFSVDDDGRVTALNGKFKGIQVSQPNYINPDNFYTETFLRSSATISGKTLKDYDYDFVDRGNVVVFNGNMSSILVDTATEMKEVYIQLPGSGSAPWSKYDRFTCIQLLGKKFYIFNESDSNAIGVNSGQTSTPINAGYYGIFELVKNTSGNYIWEKVSAGKISEFIITDV